LAVKTIGRREFNRLLPHHHVLESLMGEQIEWFANKAKTLIGTIALSKTGRSWNYAVLRRNKLGNFQVCEIGQNFFVSGKRWFSLRMRSSQPRKTDRRFVPPQIEAGGSSLVAIPRSRCMIAT
jgi:hypothetical protein